MMNRKTTKTKSDHPEIGNGNDGDGDGDSGDIDNNDDGADDDDGSTLQSLAVIAWASVNSARIPTWVVIIIMIINIMSMI